jgi:hypothetical protein
MLPKRSVHALLAGPLLAVAALAASPAWATPSSSSSATSTAAQTSITSPTTSAGSTAAGDKWVRDSIRAQLVRKPGGVVTGNSIHYAKENVTLTYKPPSTPGSAIAYDYAGCSTGEICVYTTSNVVAAGVRLSTGSLWCPWENAGNWLDLRNYGLADQIRAADSENGWWAEGVWSSFGDRGEQWKMNPYGILFNLSTDNITFLNICIKEKDLEY